MYVRGPGYAARYLTCRCWGKMCLLSDTTVLTATG